MIKTAKTYRMGEEPKERRYWLTRPAVERFQALEQMRQSFYDNASEGFQNDRLEFVFPFPQNSVFS